MFFTKKDRKEFRKAIENFDNRIIFLSDSIATIKRNVEYILSKTTEQSTCSEKVNPSDVVRALGDFDMRISTMGQNFFEVISRLDDLSDRLENLYEFYAALDERVDDLGFRIGLNEDNIAEIKDQVNDLESN